MADGHKSKPTTSITYSSVVFKDSVRIALTIVPLNSLDVSACDIGNAFFEHYLSKNVMSSRWPRSLR